MVARLSSHRPLLKESLLLLLLLLLRPLRNGQTQRQTTTE
jgi:hypothetical protein